MLARFRGSVVVLLLVCGSVAAQQPDAGTDNGGARGNWLPAASSSSGDAAETSAAAAPEASTSLTPLADPGVKSALRVTKGSGTLPNDANQLWREYDIAPYTSRVTTTNKPQQAIIDWILRETGTDAWFSETLGLLHADKSTLRVYHTREMQDLVAGIVDRFVTSEAESHVLALRLMTIGSPNWRSRAHRLMQPVSVQSPGVEAWLMSRENAAVLVAELRKRTDFRDHSSPNLMIHNGQAHTISRTQPRNYIRSVRMRDNAWPGHELEMTQIEEGYSLQLSPLYSLDGRTIDAVLKCHIDQIERLVPIAIDVPAPNGQSQRVQIQVPQLVSWRLHERFRWPADQVLVLSCGVVATPSPDKATALGIPLPFPTGPGRADALLMIESKGKASQTLIETSRTANRPGAQYQGRY